MISRIFGSKALRFAIYGAGALGLAGSAVYVVSAASTPSPTPKASAPSALCTDFVNHFASDLGTDQAHVSSAFQQAIGETLADEVKAGKLTQQQADAIKTRLAGKQPCEIGPAFHDGRDDRLGVESHLMAAAASALDLTPDQLKADLEKGMSLSQIAAAHNPPITEAQFRTKLLAALKPQLDQAVKDGKLTAAQEQKIIDRINNGRIPFWDKAPTHKPAPTSTAPSQS